MDDKDLAHDFTLMLMYLNSWREKAAGTTLARAEKSYSRATLDQLQAEGLISSSRNAKSAWITKDGEKMAKALVNVYGTLIEDFQRQVADHIEATRPRSNEPAFRLRVELKLDGRECWREIVVPAASTFADLHETIQASFLWWGYHLYDFQLTSHKEKLVLLDPNSNGVDAMYAPSNDGRRVLDATKVLLDDVFPRTKTAVYTYDYGDWWEHKVRLIETIDCFTGEMPVCTAGSGDAPPEDVGGPYGFGEFLRVSSDPTDPEHNNCCAWGEGQFFEHFDLDKVNERIRKWRSDELFLEWDERHGDPGSSAPDGAGPIGGSGLKLV